jgi:hypothetical protein
MIHWLRLRPRDHGVFKPTREPPNDVINSDGEPLA